MDFDFKWVIAMVVSLGVGAGARLLNVPAPAPPRIAGVLLVVAMTIGFTVTNYLIGDSDQNESKSAPQDSDSR